MEQFSHDSSTSVSAEDFSGQRTESRDSLMLTAALRIAGLPDQQVRVRNLSAGGMMAEYPAPIDRGALVQVEVRGVGWVQGRIAWTAEGRVGIAFEVEIDPKLARKPVGRGTTTPVYTKSIITRR